MIFCAHTQEGEGLVERLVLLFKAKTYLPGADMYGHVHQVKTRIPGEDT